MNWYIDCWKKYATFSGRARRKEYWMFVLFNLLASILANVLDGIVGVGWPVVSALYLLAVLLPSWAVFVRRLHDTDHSGWWLLFAFVPVIGTIWLFVLLIRNGSEGTNRYGADPKAAA